MIDTQETIQIVNTKIVQMGFDPRDADRNDFQRGDDRGLRFKTGTSYGEVAIQVFGERAPICTLRIINPSGIEKVLNTLQEMADDRVRNQA